MSTLMIPARILGSAGCVPGEARGTHEICESQLPDRNPEAMRRRTGIDTRYWAAPGQSMAELGARALRAALEDAGLEAEALARVIFVSSTGGDGFVPATVNALLEVMGLSGRCDGFDLNNACMGFLNAFELAARCVATGSGPIAIVTVEILSRHIDASDPRPFLVFADAAAATIIGADESGQAGVLGLCLRNDGRHRFGVAMPHPPLGEPARLRFGRSHGEIAEIVTEAIVRSTREALASAAVDIDAIDWLVPHQPNGPMLEGMCRALGVPDAKVLPVVREVGSIAAASMPFGLDRLRRERHLEAGQLLLFVGVGAGMAWGSLVYRL